MSMPWIKLYCEILEDPKVGRMPEWLFARFVKLLLIAQREDKAGMLPPVEHMLWILRPLEEAKLTQTLHELAGVGVAHQADNGCWCITNFAKRQASDDPTVNERMRRYREKLRVTTRVTDSTSTSDSKSLIFKLYTEEIGVVTPQISDELKLAIEEFDESWFEPAFREAVTRNARNWKYILAILKRWKIEGFQSNHKQIQEAPIDPRLLASEVY